MTNGVEKAVNSDLSDAATLNYRRSPFLVSHCVHLVLLPAAVATGTKKETGTSMSYKTKPPPSTTPLKSKPKPKSKSKSSPHPKLPPTTKKSSDKDSGKIKGVRRQPEGSTGSQMRKDEDNTILPVGLDLVEAEERITHEIPIEGGCDDEGTFENSLHVSPPKYVSAVSEEAIGSFVDSRAHVASQGKERGETPTNYAPSESGIELDDDFC
jgi:hypothetical protein